jgi:hypothetical protein
MQQDPKQETNEKPEATGIIEAGWQSYLKECITEQVDDLQKLDLQSTFFAGALIVYNEYRQVINKTEPGSEERARFELMGRELNKFTARLYEMAASMLKDATGR